MENQQEYNSLKHLIWGLPRAQRKRTRRALNPLNTTIYSSLSCLQGPLIVIFGPTSLSPLALFQALLSGSSELLWIPNLFLLPGKTSGQHSALPYQLQVSRHLVFKMEKMLWGQSIGYNGNTLWCIITCEMLTSAAIACWCSQICSHVRMFCHLCC